MKDNIEAFKLGFIGATLFISALSFGIGLSKAGVDGKCRLNTRLGLVNIPYRLGCWLTERLEE